MTKSDIFKAYLELWSHVENGTLDNDNFFKMRERFKVISAGFYSEVNESIYGYRPDFLGFCKSNLVFSKDLKTPISILFLRYQARSDGDLGKKQFVKALMDNFCELKKGVNGSTRYIRGVGIK